MRHGNADAGPGPVLSLKAATLRFGERTLWHNLNLDVQPGEFIAVLGPNGSGKTSMVRTILGKQRLTSGSISLFGSPVATGNRKLGYIPQQKVLDDGTPVRARDPVAVGLDVHRVGLAHASRAVRRTVDDVMDAVGASDYAHTPVGTLSGC